MDKHLLRTAMHPERLAILAACSTAPITVGELRRQIDLPARATSRHLAALESAGLVVRDDNTAWTATADWQPFFEAVAALEERPPEPVRP
jgi:DNA-binding transcriptional ArsR family regulator